MTEEDAKNAVIKYWQIIVVMGAFLMGWATINADVESLKKDATKEEQRIAALAKADTEVKEKLVEIETNQKNIKEDVDEIKDDVKEILRAVQGNND